MARVSERIAPSAEMPPPPPPAPAVAAVTAAPPPPQPAAPPIVSSIARALTLRWKVVLATAILATLVAWALAAMQPKRYRASALVAIAPAAGVDAHEAYRAVEVLQYRTVVATIAAIASAPVTEHEAQAAGSTGNYAIRAVVVPHTDLLRIEVEGPNGQQAAAIANRLPAILGKRTAAMYRFFAVAPVSAADVPNSPFFPRVGRAIAAGVILGLLLGALLAYGLDRLQPIRR
ncbi:MAG TPA: Wzz/FepE/Etk N-terminal domain-containing protein [Thermoanaerobaculia bacterium]|jgi:capsular polysaccharide biosynthesis protein